MQALKTNIKLEKGRENARKIIENLKGKGGISLPYLQVYLDMLWREDFLRDYPEGWEGEEGQLVWSRRGGSGGCLRLTGSGGGVTGAIDLSQQIESSFV